MRAPAPARALKRGQGALGRQCASHGLSLPAWRLDPALSHAKSSRWRTRSSAPRPEHFPQRWIFDFPRKMRPRNRILERVSAHERVNVYATRSSAHRFELACRYRRRADRLGRARRARLDLLRQDASRCAMTLFAGGVCAAPAAWHWSSGPSTATNAARCRGGDGPLSRLTRRRPRLRARTGRRTPPATHPPSAERTQVAKRQQSSTPAAPAVHAGGESATSCAGSDFAPPGGPA